VKKIVKPWGHEEVLHDGSDLIVLRMLLKKGEESSLHMHRRRNEYFVVLGGKGRLITGGKEIQIKPGETISIKKKQKHRWTADENLEMVEITTPPLTDLVRIDDKYGRCVKKSSRSIK
jgi:mannose-6-phosphate isomerase-like protein (cupin superfamily)